MSEQQINQILKRLDQQDTENRRIHDEQSKQLNEISSKVDPMYTLFTNATGFNRISVWIMKGLAMIGVAVAVVYGFVNWLRK